jgi:hypothetical protein
VFGLSTKASIAFDNTTKHEILHTFPNKVIPPCRTVEVPILEASLFSHAEPLCCTRELWKEQESASLKEIYYC